MSMSMLTKPSTHTPRGGFVTLTGLPALGWHRSKRDDDQLPRLPLSIRGHPARRVAILTLHAELPGCGGSAGRAGHHRLLRNHPAVGRPLRPAGCRRSAPPPLAAALALAPRRNGRVDRWQADVSLARRRCRRRDPRRAPFRPGVTPGRRAG